MPESEENRHLGMFMISVDLISVDGTPMIHSHRPARMRYYSSPIRLASILLYMLPYLTGLAVEKQRLLVPLVHRFRPSSQVKAALLTLKPQKPDAHIQVYSAQVHIDTNLRGFRCVWNSQMSDLIFFCLEQLLCISLVYWYHHCQCGFVAGVFPYPSINDNLQKILLVYLVLHSCYSLLGSDEWSLEEHSCRARKAPQSATCGRSRARSCCCTCRFEGQVKKNMTKICVTVICFFFCHETLQASPRISLQRCVLSAQTAPLNDCCMPASSSSSIDDALDLSATTTSLFTFVNVDKVRATYCRAFEEIFHARSTKSQRSASSITRSKDLS